VALGSATSDRKTVGTEGPPTSARHLCEAAQGAADVQCMGARACVGEQPDGRARPQSIHYTWRDSGSSAAAAALRATPPRRMCAIRLVGADVQTAKDVPRRATAAGWRA
jgi:hypothetical protein